MINRRFKLDDITVEIYSTRSSLTNKEIRSILMKLAQSEATKDIPTEVYYFNSDTFSIKKSKVIQYQPLLGEERYRIGGMFDILPSAFKEHLSTHKPLYDQSGSGFIILGETEDDVRKATSEMVFNLSNNEDNLD